MPLPFVNEADLLLGLILGPEKTAGWAKWANDPGVEKPVVGDGGSGKGLIQIPGFHAGGTPNNIDAPGSYVGGGGWGPASIHNISRAKVPGLLQQTQIFGRPLRAGPFPPVSDDGVPKDGPPAGDAISGVESKGLVGPTPTPTGPTFLERNALPIGLGAAGLGLAGGGLYAHYRAKKKKEEEEALLAQAMGEGGMKTAAPNVAPDDPNSRFLNPDGQLHADYPGQFAKILAQAGVGLVPAAALMGGQLGGIHGLATSDKGHERPRHEKRRDRQTQQREDEVIHAAPHGGGSLVGQGLHESRSNANQGE